MKKILAFFSNRIVLSIIGLLALALLVWFGGPHIKFGESNSAPLAGMVTRLLIIMVLVIAWGLNNLRVQRQNAKQNQELVDDLQNNQKQQGGVSDQSTEELQQINQRFTQALATLKKLRFSGLGASKALYQLPWYVIIGPPGSGKTTALVNSSLEFPLAQQFGKGSLQGVGGTRNCDWWFTNDAVLIDTAGRYTTQDSHRVVDSTAWEGFLNLLKRNRPRRPINGAIVAISLSDLLTQTEEERMLHAKTVRSRIDELMDKLQIRFPIYLMFTKGDLVSGFLEFFEDLGKEEREQVWGISLPNAPRPSDSPDFDFLQDEYDKLLARLYERVLWRVHQERDVKRRGAIQGFPQQMENLKPIINSFVRNTFVKNRYQFQPYLRGIYFSSGTQDGTPIDRLMTSVTASFGFDRSVAQQPYQQGKSFFLGKLFRDVIFPESELVGSNVRYEMIVRWARRAGFASAVLAGVITLVIWAGSVTRHKMFMGEVQDYITEYNLEAGRINEWNKDLRSVLPPLNALAKASIVYDQEGHPWLSGLGLYDPDVDSAAEDAYAVKLKELLLPRLLDYLEVFLRQGHRGGDLYSTFRTYLMFDKIEHMDRDLVIDWFRTNWSQHLHGEASRRQELEQHLKALLMLELEPSKLDTRLVNDTRSLLLRVPVSQRVYSRIRTNPKFTQQVELTNLLGESLHTVYAITPETQRALSVPLLFTKEVYDELDFSTDSTVISDVVNERWLFSDDENAKVDFVKDDLDEISAQVKKHYLDEYASVWGEALDALHITQFGSLQHANDVLAAYTDPVYSPLLAILELTKQNTELTPPFLMNLAEDKAGSKTGNVAEFLAAKTDSTAVDKRFRPMHTLLRESSGRAAPVAAIMQNLKLLHDFVYEISVAPDPGKKAFEVAIARYQSGSGNAITALTSFAKNTPQPVERWLVEVADQSWKVILNTARQYVDAEWRRQVYGPYQQGLAGRYPLNHNAGDELAPYDFSEFFKPGGTLDKYFQEYMRPFVDTSRGWGNRIIDGHSIGFSSNTLAQLRNAKAIRDVFFRENPASPGMTFELKPRQMNKSDARFFLEVGEKRVSYNHGPKFWSSLSWSAADERSRVRIAFEDLHGEQHAKAFDGPWAWFRLLDKAHIEPTRSSNIFQVTFTVKETSNAPGGGKRESVHRISYDIRAKSVKNPFSKDMLSGFRLPESI